MSIIRIYITREFTKLFLLGLSTCVALFFVIDFSMQFIDNLEKYSPPLLLSLVGFAALMILYAILARLAGPPSLSPLDAEPVRRAPKPNKYTKKSRQPSAWFLYQKPK